ncbi:MAG: tRNA dihydrouridine synthase DusB [Coriobacteriia bacterium]|nr:tRNA dihydrouridine synthase DusB [Coriobacteriia bacterium]
MSIDAFLKNPVWLAPLAGVADAPFRQLCKEQGAGLTCTEMISAKGLHFNPEGSGSERLLRLSPGETPAVVQLFGADAAIMAGQAARVAERLGADLALIDVNMGCPVQKVVKRGEGSALMKTPDGAAAIVAAMVAALAPSGVALSVKMRVGYEAGEDIAVDFALRLQEAGAALVTVHGRTRAQFYHGTSDDEAVARVAEALEIPVFASGDILTAQRAVQMLDRTPVAGVMVARGAIGHPWIFRQVAQLRAGSAQAPEPTIAERFALIRRHVCLTQECYADSRASRLRKHLIAYAAGLPGATRFRARVNAADTFDAIATLLDDYESWLLGMRQGDGSLVSCARKSKGFESV